MEEVLHLGASEDEIAETLDIGLYMGGSVSLKMVRYAFELMAELQGFTATGPLDKRRPAP